MFQRTPRPSGFLSSFEGEESSAWDGTEGEDLSKPEKKTSSPWLISFCVGGEKSSRTSSFLVEQSKFVLAQDTPTQKTWFCLIKAMFILGLTKSTFWGIFCSRVLKQSMFISEN